MAVRPLKSERDVSASGWRHRTVRSENSRRVHWQREIQKIWGGGQNENPILQIQYWYSLCRSLGQWWTCDFHLYACHWSMYQRSELDWLIDHDPAAYAELVLHGDVEEYLRNVTEYRTMEEWNAGVRSNFRECPWFLTGVSDWNMSNLAGWNFYENQNYDNKNMFDYWEQ